ncbi:MAG: DUF3810 domain-containing protein [Ruthenibacterium sp.]
MNPKSVSFKKPLIAISISGVIFILFALARNWRAGMDFFTQYITRPYKRAMMQVCKFLPFSVAELVWAVLVLCCLFYVLRTVRLLVQKKGVRLLVLCQRLLGGAAIALCIYCAYTVLWGANYYATPFETKANITAHAISVQQLTDTTMLFAEKVNAAAGSVKRDANGVFAEDRKTIFAQSAILYTPLEEIYPFLKAPPVAAKPMLFSRLMSEINYTGFYFPFTGEANVNAQEPVCFLPSTIAHELAHVRDIAPEQTANFVAILACEASEIDAYTYSGALLGYLHLSNALYGADRDAWRTVASMLCKEANADLNDNNAYWKQFETPAAKAVNKVYDGFLKSYHQPLGLKSYGAVVDLLVAYYAPQASDNG